MRWLESPRQSESNEYPQHMFLWRTKTNHPLIITKYPPYYILGTFNVEPNLWLGCIAVFACLKIYSAKLHVTQLVLFGGGGGQGGPSPSPFLPSPSPLSPFSLPPFLPSSSPFLPSPSPFSPSPFIPSRAPPPAKIKKKWREKAKLVWWQTLHYLSEF